MSVWKYGLSVEMGYLGGLHGVSILPAPLPNDRRLILRPKLLIRIIILQKVGIVITGILHQPDHDHHPEVEDEHAGVLLLEHHGDADYHQEGNHYDHYVVAGLLQQTQVRTGLLIFVENRERIGVEDEHRVEVEHSEHVDQRAGG